MWPLISVFLDIALHRRGPQDLPASQFLVGLLLVLDLAAGLVSLQVGGSSNGPQALALLVDALAYLAYIWIVLRIFRRQRRFKQTASALLGTEILLYLLGMPLLLWSRTLDTGDATQTIPALLYVALIIWSIDIGGYVLSRALERPYILGVVIVVLYVMVSMIVRGDLFGSAGT